MIALKDAVFTRPLQRPITAHGEQISEISFREPRAGDIARFGNPVKFNPFDPTSDPDFHGDRMTKMLAHLAEVNPGAIEQMTAQDWTSCAWGLAGFFLPTIAKAASTSPST